MKLSFHRPTSRILIAGTLCLVFLLGTVLGWANTHLLSCQTVCLSNLQKNFFKKKFPGNMLNLHYHWLIRKRKGYNAPKLHLVQFLCLLHN